MIFFQTHEIEAWINEDAPLLDLTSHLLGIHHQAAKLSVRTRHETRLTLMEEAAKIFEILGAQVTFVAPSSQTVPADSVILTVEGRAEALHRGWKVAMNLLEYFCGVATATHHMVSQVQTVAPIPLLVTRKHLPGLKKPMIKAILSGGAHPHRLGLSETILIFENHLNVIGGRSALAHHLPHLQQAACEKKIAIECDTLEQALQAAALGVEMIQFDKVSPEVLQVWVLSLKAQYPQLTLLIAGGVRLDNCQAYAATGVDGLVLSSVYHAKPADLGVSIECQKTP